MKLRSTNSWTSHSFSSSDNLPIITYISLQLSRCINYKDRTHIHTSFTFFRKKESTTTSLYIYNQEEKGQDGRPQLPMGVNILGFNDIVHSVVGDFPIDSEAQSQKFAISVFEDAHRGRVYVRVFIGV